jgi:hypothetical protein
MRGYYKAMYERRIFNYLIDGDGMAAASDRSQNHTADESKKLLSVHIIISTLKKFPCVLMWNTKSSPRFCRKFTPVLCFLSSFSVAVIQSHCEHTAPGIFLNFTQKKKLSVIITISHYGSQQGRNILFFLSPLNYFMYL